MEYNTPAIPTKVGDELATGSEARVVGSSLGTEIWAFTEQSYGATKEREKLTEGRDGCSSVLSSDVNGVAEQAPRQ